MGFCAKHREYKKQQTSKTASRRPLTFIVTSENKLDFLAWEFCGFGYLHS